MPGTRDQFSGPKFASIKIIFNMQISQELDTNFFNEKVGVCIVSVTIDNDCNASCKGTLFDTSKQPKTQFFEHN